MTDDNSNPVDMDNLDAFEDEFFQREPAKEEPAKEVEEVSENEDNPLAAEDDTDAPDQTGDEDEDGEAEKPEPEQKPKSKTQQRIEKLLERERLANERAAALEARLSALEAPKPNEVKQEPPALRNQLPAGAPSPDAKDENGDPIYPLGEFDSKFIYDLTQFTFDTQMKAKEQKEQQDVQARNIAEQQRVIQDNWNTRLSEFEKEVPEVREDISDLVGTFQSIDPGYGEYLASVIMANDSGPQIMHYLSQNIGEAQKIVASGPAAATLAIGRLEARLATAPEAKEEKRNLKRVSDAPPPPASRARGSGSRFVVNPDTDDLDAFEREFFKKK